MSIISFKRNHKENDVSNDTIDNFVDKIKNKDITSAYEILKEPLKGYMDLESISSYDTSFVCLAYIMQYLTNNDIDNITIFNASRWLDYETFKNSFHIIFNNLVFESGLQMKNYFISLRMFNEDKDIIKIDTSVYVDKGKQQLMRLPYTIKDRDISSKLMEVDVDESFKEGRVIHKEFNDIKDNYKNYLISLCNINNNTITYNNTDKIDKLSNPDNSYIIMIIESLRTIKEYIYTYISRIYNSSYNWTTTTE